MAIQGNYSNLTIKAGEDLNDLTASGDLFKAITVSGSTASTGETALGILQYGGKTGEFVTLGYAGVMKFSAGNSVTSGTLLTVNSLGYFVSATTDSYIIGRCLGTHVSSGAVGTGVFNFATPVKKA